MLFYAAVVTMTFAFVSGISISAQLVTLRFDVLVTSRPVLYTLPRYRWVGNECRGVAVCVRACARIQPRGTGMRESGHGVFRPRRTPLFHLLFIQKPTAAGLALARIVSQSRVQCTLAPPHIVLVAAPPPCYQ